MGGRHPVRDRTRTRTGAGTRHRTGARTRSAARRGLDAERLSDRGLRAERVLFEDAGDENNAVEESAVDEPAEPAFDFVGINESGVEQSRIEEPSVEESTAAQTVEHVLMLSTAAGYRILIGDGAQPTPSIEVDGIVFEVSGRMSSPFPGDTRTAYFATRTTSAV